MYIYTERSASSMHWAKWLAKVTDELETMFLDIYSILKPRDERVL